MEKNNSNNLDPEKVELYHDNGRMPDFAYYQLNGKTAQENYADQKNKIMKDLSDRQNDSEDQVKIIIESKVN